MDSRTGSSDYDVVFSDPIAENQAFLLANSRRESDQIEPSVLCLQFWNDGCLSPDNRHPRLLCTFHEADRDLIHDRAVRFVHGHVVEEADGLRARADQIVCAHRDTINPDCVILFHHLSNEDLRPDTISVEAQHLPLTKVDKTRVMSNRKDRPSNLAFSRRKSRL